MGFPDFVRTFFDNPYPKHKAGTIFHYDTAATVTLCGIVEKLSGKPMLEYMRPVLDAIGFSKDAWCIMTPEGRAWAGSGVLCTTRDLARFGLFCLRQGEVDGKQLVSRGYMRAATSRQINTTATGSGTGAGTYGYQFWMLREGGFACCGMGSQFALMMPKYDTVMAITADTQGIDNAEDMIRDAYYRMQRKFADHALADDPALNDVLSRRSQLSLPVPTGKAETPLAGKISGVRYAFEENRFGFKWMQVDVRSDACTLRYEKKTGVHTLPLFMGRFGELRFPDAYFGKRVGIADTHYRCVSAAGWDSPNTLLGMVYAVDDYLGPLKMQLTFVDDTLSVFMTTGAEAFFGDYRGVLAGRALKD